MNRWLETLLGAVAWLLLGGLGLVLGLADLALALEIRAHLGSL